MGSESTPCGHLDLARFRLSQMVTCAAHLRTLGDGGHCMEETAGRITSFFYDTFADPQTGGSACALVRFFKTHSYGDLPENLKQVSDATFPNPTDAPWMKCLVLLASRGDLAEWNDRRSSTGHRAIPLPSEAIVEQAPMISQLIKQLGLNLAFVLQPNPDPKFLLESQTASFNVFHVPEALGSPYIPAQREFVEKFGIRSVLGFGGMLPSGNLYATILFSKVAIPQTTAELFRTLALNVKLAILPFEDDRVFSENLRAIEQR